MSPIVFITPCNVYVNRYLTALFARETLVRHDFETRRFGSITGLKIRGRKFNVQTFQI